jgi:hypothetical protein
MESAILVALVGGLVAVATAIIAARQSTRQQARQFELDLEKLRQEVAADFHRDRDQYRTQFMAEQVAMQLLQEPAFILRSFDQIKKRLGGFDDNELKRILVRAGAIRFEGLNGKELWGLLSRPEVRKALGSQRLAEEIGVVSEEESDKR